MNYFLTSRKPNLIYKIILNSFKNNFEKKKKLKSKLLLIRNEKIPNLEYLIFLYILFFQEKFFKRIRELIFILKIQIGNHVLSRTYRNFKSYSSKIYFYYFMLKNFYIAGCIIKTSKKYLKKLQF